MHTYKQGPLRSFALLPYDLRNRRNLARGGYSSSPVLDLQGQARRRHSFGEFLFRGGRPARTTGGKRQGRGSRWGPVVLDSTSRRPTRCPPLGPPPSEIDFGAGRLGGRGALYLLPESPTTSRLTSRSRGSVSLRNIPPIPILSRQLRPTYRKQLEITIIMATRMATKR